MYLYEVKYNDNIVEYIEATDIQNACSIANCRIAEIVSVTVVHEVEGVVDDRT